MNKYKKIIEDLNPYILASTIAFNTGDLSCLSEKYKPDRNIEDGSYLPNPVKEEELRKLLWEMVKNGKSIEVNRKLELNPNNKNIETIIRWLAGDYYDGKLLDLYLKELGIRRPPNRPSINPDKGFLALIIGAGISGIGLAIKLKEADIPFVVIEKNPDLGGTWYENKYPGCRVDVASSLYSYSFAQNPNWKHIYSSRQELFEYLDSCAVNADVRDHIEFESQVTDLVFDDKTNLWSVTIQKQGKVREIKANLVVSAIGQLNKKKYPNIPGLDSFSGKVIHSADWRADMNVNLRENRVGVIGSASTAAQLVPELVKLADEVHLFQRSPSWFHSVPHYKDETPVEISYAFKNIPNFLNWFRFWYFIPSIEGMLGSVAVDDGWDPVSTGSFGKKNHQLMLKMRGYIESQFADRPDLLSQVIPKYPPGSKRPVLDDGSWAKALKSQNAFLHTVTIKMVCEDHLVLNNGSKVYIDTLILATGFSASSFLSDINVTRHGHDLQDQWDGNPKAYLGICIENFPNFFMMYGPNTNGVVNANILFFSECQISFILNAINLLLTNFSRLLVRPEAVNEFCSYVDDGNGKMAWGRTTEKSWYKDAKGRVSQNWPYSCSSYWSLTSRVDLSKFYPNE